MPPLFARNVELGPPLKLSSWRKVAIGTWRSVGDPSVYGVMDVNATAALAYIERVKSSTGTRITLTHVVGKAIANTLALHPEINCILRFGRLYPRRSVDIFIQVATDPEGRDLSGMTVRSADKKSVEQIAIEIADRVKVIRSVKGDPSFARMKLTMGLLPGILARWVLDFTGFLTYSLNIWTSLLGTPRDPFGSVMVTNIGSLGLETAFAPLVPYSRVPLLIVVGSATDKPVVIGNKIEIAPVVRICVTLDHRLIDGVHASRMSATLKRIFEDPETGLK